MSSPRKPGRRSSPLRPSAIQGGVVRKPAPGPVDRRVAGRVAVTEKALVQLLRFEYPADAVLSRFFRENKALGPRDREFVAETCYGVLRELRELHAIAGSTGARRLLLAALTRHSGIPANELALAMGEGEQRWAATVRAVDARELDFNTRTNLPDWLLARLRETMGDAEIAAMAAALNEPAPLDLRVNAIKAKRDDVLRQFERQGIGAAPCPFAPDGIRLVGKPALQAHQLYLSGDVEVQDEGSQLLCALVAPRRGEMVVDFCAGAGGKTLALGAAMRSTGRLYAFDVSAPRLTRLGERLKRSGLSNVHPVAISGENDPRVKRLAGKIDRVLVDAPCSGLGTLRRNPDLKWRQTPESVVELVAKQSAILASAARLVKPGGRLVYATCSILRDENEGVVEAFLAAHPAFRLVSAQEELARQHIPLACGTWFRVSPATHGMDGFFAAILERVRETPVIETLAVEPVAVEGGEGAPS